MKHSPRVPINALPDDAFLEIFKFYVDRIRHKDAWHTLVHVCRKWRYVVFSSPRWLHLELRCTNKSPVKKLLDIWPALPIVIDAYITNSRRSGVRNLIAALKPHDVVCRIKIWRVPNSLLKSAAMKKRFPKLAGLMLSSNESNAPVIPRSFLGGSAPRLRSLDFSGIPFPFPALGKLLLSATNLVACHLLDIPNSGIISPDLIVTTLSTLTRLRKLSIGFRSPRSRADRERRHLSLLKRLVLPSLTDFYFEGDSEYLEDIVGRIDAPALDSVTIYFFNQLVFDTPLLRDFFGRTKPFQEPHRADVLVSIAIKFRLFQLKGTAEHCMLEVTISSKVAEWQLSSLAQFCSSSLPPLPTLERLSIRDKESILVRPEWARDMESSPWLELLHPFVTVRDLVLQSETAHRVALALQELTGNTVTDALPALRQVFVDDVYFLGPIQEGFAPFIAARQLSGHPVALRLIEAQKRSW